MEESDVEEKDRIEEQKRKGICAIPVLLVSTASQAMGRPAKQQRPGALKSTFK